MRPITKRLVGEFRQGWQGISRPSLLFSVGFSAGCLALSTAARWLLATLRPDVYFTPYFPAVFFATALAGYHLWCYGLMEEVTRAAVDQGLPRPAAAGMVAGLTRAAGEFALLAPPEDSIREPLDRHGMPGTMTAQGLAVLERLQAFQAWRQAYGRAIDRLKGRPAS